MKQFILTLCILWEATLQMQAATKEKASLVCYEGERELYSFYLEKEPSMEVQNGNLVLTVETEKTGITEVVLKITDDLRFSFQYRDYDGENETGIERIVYPEGKAGYGILGEKTSIYTLDGKQVNSIKKAGTYVVKTANGNFKIQKK